MNALERKLNTLRQGDSIVSGWLMIDQARIDQFADATDDHQWIHVDVERATRELPTGNTIAHGFLTLSLTAGLMSDIIVTLPDVVSSFNYGLNRVRFLAPVPAGSRVRNRAMLVDWEKTDKGYLTTWKMEVEVEGREKPVCVAEALALLRAE